MCVSLLPVCVCVCVFLCSFVSWLLSFFVALFRCLCLSVCCEFSMSRFVVSVLRSGALRGFVGLGLRPALEKWDVASQHRL